MAYFPFYIDIQGKNCLVAGGGKVALRKIEKLIPFKPKIKVVAPQIHDEITKISDIEIVRRGFEESDLNDVFFVISASDDEVLNSRIFHICKSRGILVNTVDDKEKCGFIFPALVHKEDVTVGISTSGKSPLCAGYLREKIDGLIDKKTLDIVEILGKYRLAIKEKFCTEQTRKSVFEALLQRCIINEDLPSDREINFMLEELKKHYEN